MGLETGNYIGDLNSSNPTNSDSKSQGDDHFRLIKTALKNCFSGFDGHILMGGSESQGATINDYVVSVDPAITVYTNQSIVFFKATHTNTGACTIKISSLAAVDLKSVSGGSLVSGDIVIDSWYAAVYNGTNFRLIAVTQNYIDQLSFGTALPNQAGNSGKILRTDGTNASWYKFLSGAGSILTTSTTLTATSESIQRTEPTGYGMSIIMPDATNLYVDAGRYCIDNTNSGFPVLVRNNGGALVAVVPAGKFCISALINNSTANGVWRFIGADRVGCTAELETPYLDTIRQSIDLGSNREFILGYDSATSYSYCVVYNQLTNAFTNVVQIRAAAVADRLVAISAGTDKVLVVSCTGATAFEAVIVDTSGANPVPGTAATATLSANMQNFAERGAALVASGSSFVTSYNVATPALQIRAMTVSGSTVTIGAATTLSGTQGTASGIGALMLPVSGGVITASSATTTIYIGYYGISGTTITPGTGASTTLGTITLNMFGLWGAYAVVLFNQGGSSIQSGIVTVSGTVVTVSWNGVSMASTLADAEFVGANKLLLLSNDSTSNANILTNTTGTGSLGTPITQSSDTARVVCYVDGNNVIVESGTTASRRHDVIDCSGSSPVLGRSISRSLVGIDTTNAANNQVFEKKTSNCLVTGKYKRRVIHAYSAVDATPVLAFGVIENNNFHRESDAVLVKNISSTASAGSSSVNRWLSSGGGVIARVEVVAS